jgi:hypothetical protein
MQRDLIYNVGLHSGENYEKVGRSWVATWGVYSDGDGCGEEYNRQQNPDSSSGDTCYQSNVISVC